MENYQEAVSGYRRCLLTRDFDQAMKFLDAAIRLAPCHEALPTLMGWKDELAPKVKPVRWWEFWRLAI